MSLNKSSLVIKEDMYAEILNVPVGKTWDIMNKDILIKRASSITSELSKDSLGGFDLKKASVEYPDALFVKVFAIKEDEINDNGDLFPKEELKKAAHTFIGVPVFVNHQNTDIEKSRGKVVHAWYDEKAGGIYTINMVDAVAYPKLAKSIRDGFTKGSSMGATVTYSVCSICHKAASTSDQYCSHIKERKNRKFSGSVKCEYHKSLDKNGDECPICGKEENKELIHKEAQVFEYNYGVKFIEDSFVVNPACHDCLVQDVLNPELTIHKISGLSQDLRKIAANLECATGTCGLQKVAGKKEIDLLANAMDGIEHVAKSMMAQKQYISMDYVSDLVKTLAEIQSVADELIEMGYLQLSSPTIADTEIDKMTLPKDGNSNQFPSQNNVLRPQNTIPSNPPVQQPQIQNTPVNNTGGIETENMQGLGSITKPKFSSNNLKNIEEFNKLSSTLIDSLQKINDLKNNLQQKELVMSIDNNTESGIKKVAESKDVVLEKNLENAKGSGERKDDTIDKVTEKQLESHKASSVNETKSDSPTERKGNAPEVITEKQLDSVKTGYVIRWKDVPDVITEKQWKDSHREIGSELSKSQDDIITQKQLQDFLSKHKYNEAEVTTEKQLNSQKGDLSRVAEAEALIKAASNTLADAIAIFNKTPNEIKKAASFVNQLENKNKASFLTLVNALPYKKEQKQAEIERSTYFFKTAGKDISTNAVDAIILSASNYLNNYSADRLLTAISKVASNSISMEKIEALAKEKIASFDQVVVAETDDFDSALKNFNKEEDGLYQVQASFKDIGTTLNDRKSFIVNAKNFAKLKVAETLGFPLEVELMDLSVDTDKKTLVATVKDVEKLSEKEKEAVKIIKANFDNLDSNISSEGESMESAFSNMDDNEYEDMDKCMLNGDEECTHEGDCDAKDMDGWKGMDNDENIETIDPNVKGSSDPNDSLHSVLARTENRKNIVKKAQLFGGQMGGQGGLSQAPGAGASLPNNAPPQGQGFEGFEGPANQGAANPELDEASDEALSAKAPGSICPVCGSDNVDIVRGQGKCGNCGAEMKFEVDIKVTKWPKVLDTDTDSDSEKETEEPAGGEGFKMPQEGNDKASGLPMAASENTKKVVTSSVEETRSLEKFASVVQITQDMLKKMAESNISVGDISPITGSKSVVKLQNGERLCLDSGIKFNIEYATKGKDVYARFSWKPILKASCKECERRENAFKEALASKGLTEEKFNEMSVSEQAEVAYTLKKAKAIKSVKVASKENSILSEIKKTASVEGKFPTTECQERIARAYGENAIALSGPYEGERLADCVCKSLKKANVYSNNLAIKVASIWKDREACVECTETFAKNLDVQIEKAAALCDMLSLKFAQADDLLAAELTNETAGDDLDPTPDPEGSDHKDNVETEEVDPFNDQETVLVEMPKELLNSLKESIEKAEGNDTSEDTSANTEPSSIEIEVSDTPEGAADGAGTVDNLSSPETDAADVVENSDTEVPSEDSTDIAVTDNATDTLDNTSEEAVKTEGDVETADSLETASEETSEENKDMKDGKDCGCDSKVETVGEEVKTGEDDKEDTKEETKEASLLPKGNGNMQKSYVDLSKVRELLAKSAKKVEVKNPQDATKVEYSKGQTLGNEEKFDAKEPKVPSGKATIGDESSDLQKLDKPEVPTGDSLMGGEKDKNEGYEDLKPEMTNNVGENVVTTASSRNERIDAVLNSIKKASETKKLKETPVSSTKVKQYLGNEKESIGEVPAPKRLSDMVPKAKGEGFIGKEKESIGEKLTPDNAAPSIPTKDSRIKGEKDNNEIKSEKTTELTGNNADVLAQSNAVAATKLAGKLLQSGKISVDELSVKIAEYSKYSETALKEVERLAFSSEKGLKNQPDGIEQAVVISVESSENDAKKRQKFAQVEARNEIAQKLAGFFTLSKRNEEAAKTDENFKRIFEK